MRAFCRRRGQRCKHARLRGEALGRAANGRDRAVDPHSPRAEAHSIAGEACRANLPSILAALSPATAGTRIGKPGHYPCGQRSGLDRPSCRQNPNGRARALCALGRARPAPDVIDVFTAAM